MRGSFRRGTGGGLAVPSSLGGAVGASEEVDGIGGSGLALNSSLEEVGDDPEEVLVGDIGDDGLMLASNSSLGRVVVALDADIFSCVGGSGLVLIPSLGDALVVKGGVFVCGIGGDGFMLNSSLAEVGDDPEEVLVGDIGGNDIALTSNLGRSVDSLENVILSKVLNPC
jgi:hypothetical protein